MTHRWVSFRAAATRLTRDINKTLIAAYGLDKEVSPEPNSGEFEYLRLEVSAESGRLISYAIGCMMGRYSLDEPGLIYAHAGNVGFDRCRYEKKFPADADGIVPLTDEPWFTDDAASRVSEFLRAVWGPDSLEENMVWVAQNLGVKGTETPDETIRRYLADKFYKDNLQTYKKRPIYWLFSSGKQGAAKAASHEYAFGSEQILKCVKATEQNGSLSPHVLLAKCSLLMQSALLCDDE